MSDENLLDIFKLLQEHLKKSNRIINYYIQYSSSSNVIIIRDFNCADRNDDNYWEIDITYYQNYVKKIVVSNISHMNSKIKMNEEIAENIIISIAREIKLNKIL